MLIQSYSLAELRFAYCYRLYLRWRTHCARPCPPLPGLAGMELQNLAHEFDIRVLESASDLTDLLALVSLRPTETISGCAGKLKGRTSKWLREALQLAQPADLLSRSYFACTVGKSSAAMVDQYLSRQSEHHGYDQRALPPIHVENFALSAADEERITLKHAVVVAQWHLVLATRWRRGVFGAAEGRGITEAWRKLLTSLPIALSKVSFVPDHVHVALRAHPSASPAQAALDLMNSAQQTIFEQFPEAILQAKLARLWQPSAYLGSFGDLVSPKISKYINNWADKTDPLAAGITLPDAEAGDLAFDE